MVYSLTLIRIMLGLLIAFYIRTFIILPFDYFMFYIFAFYDV